MVQQRRRHTLNRTREVAPARVSQTRVEGNREAQPLKVLWISPNFFPYVGGLETYVERLVASLAQLCDVGLVTKAGQWFPSDEPLSHFTVSEIQPKGFEARWQTADELATVVSIFGPHVVHLGGAEAAVHRGGIPNWIPVFATVHGNDLTLAKSASPDRDHVSRIVEGLNQCEHIFAVSNHTAGLCRQWGITTPISVVTAGCDTDSFHPWPALGEQARLDFGLPRNVPIILTVSRIVGRKGHLCVLEAIRRLPFRVHWVVVGDGSARPKLIREVIKTGMEKSVSFWGIVSDDDMPGLYNACDLFVFTPEERHLSDGRIDSEGFGLVFLEASACGKPVIGTRISGCKDAVIDGATGILVPPSDPVLLSRTIEFLLKNADVAKDMGLGGLVFAHASGGWRRLARQTLEKYQEVLYRDSEPVEPPQLRMPF